MIGLNLKKVITIAGAVAAVAVAMPALSEAHAHYTGKTPPAIAMMANPFEPMEPAVTKHTKGVSRHGNTVATLSSKSALKKHKKLTVTTSKHKATSLTKKKI